MAKGSSAEKPSIGASTVKHESASLWESVVLQHHRLHNNVLLVKLLGCDSPEQVREYTNRYLAVAAEMMPKLVKGEVYWHQLLGLQVKTTTEVSLGRLVDVFATGANDVLVVEGDRQRYLPYIDDVVREVDLSKGVIVVDWDPDF